MLSGGDELGRPHSADGEPRWWRPADAVRRPDERKPVCLPWSGARSAKGGGDPMATSFEETSGGVHFGRPYPAYGEPTWRPAVAARRPEEWKPVCLPWRGEVREINDGLECKGSTSELARLRGAPTHGAPHVCDFVFQGGSPRGEPVYLPSCRTGVFWASCRPCATRVQVFGLRPKMTPHGVATHLAPFGDNPLRQ